jgi:PST family polysaccharide transporter
MNPNDVPHVGPADPINARPPLEQLAAHSSRSWLTVVLAKGGVNSVQFLTQVVMARLLAPADFGVLTMVMSVIGIATIFQDLGLSAVTVSQKNLQQSQVNTLFWINVGLGSVMGMLAFLTSPLLTSFYADPRVAGVGAALSLNFIISGLATQHLALLRRNVRFNDLSMISFASTLLSSLVALAMAAFGARYWALVTSSLASNLITAGMAWHYSKWRPGWPGYDASIRPMLPFGGYLVVFALFQYVAMNLQYILLGRFWNSSQVAYFGRGYQLMTLFGSYVHDPFDMTARSTLARMQPDPPEFRRYFLHTLALIMMLAAPLATLCAVLGGDIVGVLLGPAWKPSGEVLQILALGFMPNMLSFTTGWIFLARGDALRMMRWGIFGWSIVIISILAGISGGPTGVAIACSANAWILFLPCLIYSFKDTGLKLSHVWKACAPVAGAALSAGAVLWLMWQVLSDWKPWLRLALGLPAYSLLYAGLLLLPFGQRPLLKDLWSMIRRSPVVAAAI